MKNNKHNTRLRKLRIMPRVKIDYVVSFSSEDPEHPASNLLAWEVSKKKWLCKKGESSCSVVLQLARAVKISAVHIGAYHAALVEVLVARSEKADDQFQVLVPSCVFVPPGDSRRDLPAERVRSFCADQLASDTRHQRWDRLRVVCSQPYNKHCKYGLSFIHIDEVGESNATSAPQARAPPTSVQPAPVPQRLLALDTFSSDEDDFRPGELFAQHLQKNSDSSGGATDTGAQIRQATSQALKNMSDSSTKLMKTSISKPAGKRDRDTAEEGHADRSRVTLMYTDEDQRPHSKIDQVVQRHKEHKQREDQEKPARQNERMDKEKLNESSRKGRDSTRTPKRKKSSSPATQTAQSVKPGGDSTFSDRQRRTEDRTKRQRLNSGDTDEVGEESTEPHTLLKDYVLVLSGYENPQRANIRNTALALGARVQRDWGPGCTHLITPKLRAVRAAGRAPAVRAEWLLQCAARRRLLPWRWFATEPHERRPEPRAQPRAASPPPPRAGDDSAAECDTDDEIERVLRRRETDLATLKDDSVATHPTTDRKRLPSADITGNASGDEEDPSTDEGEEASPVPKFGGALPNFFEGHTFAIDAEKEEAQRLARYITAYGGLVLQLSQLDDDSSVEYVVCATGRTRGTRVTPAWLARGTRVTPAWLARCHGAGALLPPDG